MGRIDTDPDALRRHANLCRGLADDLLDGTAPSCSADFQATAAAVAAMHGSFAAARATAVDRMYSTVAAVQATADEMEAGEHQSASGLRSLIE